jgi:hypothetical protein
MAKHDENKDLRSFSRIGKVSLGDKTLRASKTVTIGIHMWGRIDYLTKYCGWHFVWDGSAGYTENLTDNQFVRAQKKDKIIDKTKKVSKM